MKAPEIRQCPGCGEKPAPMRGERGVLGVWCDSCGFNASIADIMKAEYLVNLHPALEIRTAADRISRRVPLGHNLAKVA